VFKIAAIAAEKKLTRCRKTQGAKHCEEKKGWNTRKGPERTLSGREGKDGNLTLKTKS